MLTLLARLKNKTLSFTDKVPEGMNTDEQNVLVTFLNEQTELLVLPRERYQELLDKELKVNYELTDQQITVIIKVAQGWTNPEIASQLSYEEGTIRNTVSEIMNVLHIENRTRTEMVIRALKEGLISLDDIPDNFTDTDT
jgi:DNA-binding NarL/FixJ family response regulator